MSSRNSRNNKPRAASSSKDGRSSRYSSGLESAFGAALPNRQALSGDVRSSVPSFRSVQMAAPSPIALSGSLNLRSASGYDDVPTVPKKQQFKVDKSASLSVGAPFGSSPFLGESNNSTPHPQFIYNEDTTQGVTGSASKSSSQPTTFQPLKWTITVLPAVPFYHPLDRSALSISVSLSVLTARVSDFMRIHSISCTVQVADGRLDCTTPDFLSFVVKLWKTDDGRDDDLTVASLGEDDTVDVTIEVQRRQGSSVEMQSVRNSLFHVIQHGGDGLAAKRPSFTAMEMSEELVAKVCAAPPLPMPRPVGFSAPARPPPRVPPVPAASVVPDSLEICTELLSSERPDQGRLGMESLDALTDNTKVCNETATSVAKILLVGDEDGNTVLRDAVEQNLIGYGGALDETDSPYSAGVNHTLALKILANSLERMQPLWHELDFSCDFWHSTVATLKANLERAATRPLEASLSAKSLRLLQAMDPSVCGNLTMDVVQNAHSYGKARHQSLEFESKQLIDRLITSF